MGDEALYPPSPKSGPKGLPDEREARAIKQAADYWAVAVRETPLNRLRYYDALIARPGYLDGPGQREAIKERLGQLIREIDATAILGDPSLVSMVRFMFGERGLARLREKVKSQHSDVLEDMAHPVHQRGKV